jgi:hypothetical protein
MDSSITCPATTARVQAAGDRGQGDVQGRQDSSVTIGSDLRRLIVIYTGDSCFYRRLTTSTLHANESIGWSGRHP